MIPINKKRIKKNSETFIPSDEQQYFVDKALEGSNILVDACIGSGKTSSIQYLCNQMPNKRILYLTYNKLLKIDAKKKIKDKNVMVTNYHGFASWILIKNGISPGYSDSIQQFIKAKLPLPSYDVLIIDEYQDIEQELAELLNYVKACNPGIQIIAVGDMAQKIYDKTTLNVMEFIREFLDDYIEIEFTKCFRLSAELAEMLGRIWHKDIKGVNEDCIVESMNAGKVFEFLKDKNPKDIICLGSRTGKMTDVLNELENKCPEVFNKKTVYASIRVSGENGATEPTTKSAIFTTFDSSKGMERPICVVFDWTCSYWNIRLNKPGQSYEILRNIFCVAASRGKEKIIFVTNNTDELLSEEDLGTDTGCHRCFEDSVLIDSMFDFKYKEDIEAAFNLLKLEKIDMPLADTYNLNLRDHDELIDLLPCISIYQKSAFFTNNSIDREIEQFLSVNKDLLFLFNEKIANSSTDEKILFLVSLETKHDRYRTQVSPPLVTEEEHEQLCKRLSLIFSKDENVQVSSEIDFCSKKGDLLFKAVGMADVIKDNIVYSVEYVGELQHVQFLTCACYMIANGKDDGIIWNVKDNSMYAITIPDKDAFMDTVAVAITKGKLKKFYR